MAICSFIQISDFLQFRHSNFLIKKMTASSRKLTRKIDNIKVHLGVHFNEPVWPSTKGGEHYYVGWLPNNKQKENRLILCVYIHYKNLNIGRALIHRIITKQWVKNELIKKNTLALCVLCMCSNYKKTSSRSFKRIPRW